MAEVKSAFSVLNAIDCGDHIEKKNGLTYLSWAWAWQIAKKNFPDATYTVYENKDGWNYFTDGKTCWVKTGVTIQGQEYIEFLPVMDFKNRSIPLEYVTSFDVNKSIQRSLTKALARHGLGLYIYAGEDIPEAVDSATACYTQDAQDQAPAQMDNDRYWQLIEAYCYGHKSKTGRDLREVYNQIVSGNKVAMAKFDNDCQNYRFAHNLNL